MVTKAKIGFKNPYPRRGTPEDAWLRKTKLKSIREPLPKKRQLATLEEVAEREMARVRAGLGL